MNILVLANLPQRILDQILLCKELRKIDNSFSFLFILDHLNKASFIQEEKGFGYFVLKHRQKAGKCTTQKIPNKRNSDSVVPAFRKTLQLIKNTSLFELIKVFRNLILLKGLYSECKKIINDFRPDIIIANGDRHPGVEQAVLKIARENNIKIIIPYLVYSGDTLLIYRRKNNPLFENSSKSPLITKYTTRKYSAQVLTHNNKQYLFNTPSMTIALDKFDTLSDYPWCVGNGIADIVCVDNNFTFDRYLNNKVPKEKLRIIGDVAYDRLYGAYKQKDKIKTKIFEKYNLVPNKKVVIISLPQLAEHNILDWEKHCEEIVFLVKALEEQGQNLLISLHPRMDYEKYVFLESLFDCKILEVRLFEVLPIANLFVSTFSSTVVWAVLCGINSVVVDFYNFNYNMYDAYETVRIIKNKEKLSSVLKELLEARLDFSNDWKRLSRDDVFDGKTIERYQNLLWHTANESEKSL